MRIGSWVKIFFRNAISKTSFPLLNITFLTSLSFTSATNKDFWQFFSMSEELTMTKQIDFKKAQAILRKTI